MAGLLVTLRGRDVGIRYQIRLGGDVDEVIDYNLDDRSLAPVSSQEDGEIQVQIMKAEGRDMTLLRPERENGKIRWYTEKPPKPLGAQIEHRLQARDAAWHEGAHSIVSAHDVPGHFDYICKWCGLGCGDQDTDVFAHTACEARDPRSRMIWKLLEEMAEKR